MISWAWSEKEHTVWSSSANAIRINKWSPSKSSKNQRRMKSSKKQLCDKWKSSKCSNTPTSYSSSKPSAKKASSTWSSNMFRTTSLKSSKNHQMDLNQKSSDYSCTNCLKDWPICTHSMLFIGTSSLKICSLVIKNNWKFVITGSLGN